MRWPWKRKTEARTAPKPQELEPDAPDLETLEPKKPTKIHFNNVARHVWCYGRINSLRMPMPNEPQIRIAQLILISPTGHHVGYLALPLTDKDKLEMTFKIDLLFQEADFSKLLEKWGFERLKSMKKEGATYID